jgi:hypothetical protein
MGGGRGQIWCYADQSSHVAWKMTMRNVTFISLLVYMENCSHFFAGKSCHLCWSKKDAGPEKTWAGPNPARQLISFARAQPKTTQTEPGLKKPSLIVSMGRAWARIFGPK